MFSVKRLYPSTLFICYMKASWNTSEHQRSLKTSAVIRTGTMGEKLKQKSSELKYELTFLKKDIDKHHRQVDWKSLIQEA